MDVADADPTLEWLLGRGLGPHIEVNLSAFIERGHRIERRKAWLDSVSDFDDFNVSALPVESGIWC